MDRMTELVAILNEYAHQYYVLDMPTVSDAEYDVLYDELLRLEKEQGRVLPDSPTLRVGGAPLDAFEKHTHLAPLYSLDKAKTAEELNEWRERCEKTAGMQEYSLEYKFDGITINLTYEGGNLVGAATRGDGITGEQILAQVRTISSIPLSVPFQGRMEVHGEAIMRLSVLEKYNETAKEPLKNARNAVAGALRNLDPSVTAERKLDAFFYNIGYIEGKTFKNHFEMIDFLQENRFKISEYERRYTDFDALITDAAQAGDDRGKLDFLIDGMVIKISDFSAREELGYTQKFPRWAIAYKFAAEEMTTVVENVNWDVGRTGKLTPTAELASVDIGGVTVRRATLNNYEDIMRKRVRLGSRVFIRRSNDVIPEILGAAVEDDTLPMIEKPTHCPACGTELEEIGPNLFCPNTLSCKPQLVMRMVHYVSRDAMNIESLSEKTLELLFRELEVSNIAELYELTREQLMTLPGFKEKRADNIITSIENSKNPELAEFVFALGINNVGKKTAKDLAERYGTFENIKKATLEELVEMRDIGEVVAECIVDFFKREQVIATLERLEKNGVKPRDFVKAEGVFSGKNVVITGTLENYKRAEAQAAVEAHGGTVQSAVAKTTDYLIAGEKAGSKLAKAEKLGIAVLSEQQFMEMIGNA